MKKLAIILFLLFASPHLAHAQQTYWDIVVLGEWVQSGNKFREKIGDDHSYLKLEHYGKQSAGDIASILATRNVSITRLWVLPAVASAINSDPNYIVVYARRMLWTPASDAVYACSDPQYTTMEECIVHGECDGVSDVSLDDCSEALWVKTNTWTETSPAVEANHAPDPANDTMNQTASAQWKSDLQTFLNARGVTNAKLVKWFYQCTDHPEFDNQTACEGAGHTWEDPNLTYLYYSNRLRELIRTVLD